MNYCEFIKCGDYTGHGCKVLGGNIKCRLKYDAEPYADACVAARDKWWVEQIEKFIGTCLRLESSGLSTCDDCGDQPYQCPMYEMALLKREVGQ